MNIDKVEKVLSDFIKEYQTHPFDYLYEFEIQAILYSMLRNEINDRIHHTFETNNQKTFTKVKGEYHPLSDKRLDIAILENNRISKLDPTVHSRAYDRSEMTLYWQKVDIGIEIKLQAIFTKQMEGFNKDIKKLQKLMGNIKNESENGINTGIALLFFHKHEDFNDHNHENGTTIEITSGKLNALIITPKTVTKINV
ncbi:hypothetical protein ACFL5P_01210 [candidate division KSB1 bacterium]